MAGLLDFFQGASNAAASNISAPVDGIAWLLKKAGMDIQNPIGGSDWMESKGLTKKPENKWAGLLGESVGGLAPILAAAKAPQIAKGLLQGADNLAAPRTMNPQTGAIVWHGSPHKFDKFRTDKIGTGEGAQAYGHGLYLAESPDVARGYAQTLDPMAQAARSGLDAEGTAARVLQAVDYDKRKAVKELTSRKNMPHVKGDAAWAAKMDAAIAHIQGAEKTSNLYKTDIPEEAVARFLDWDKPLSQQAPEVLAQLQRSKNKQIKAMLDFANKEYQSVPGEFPTAGEAFKLMSMNHTGRASADSAKASALLAQQGIPGIRYLDGGSRGAGQGSSNFVAFDPEMIRILERNGQATGAAPWQPGEWRGLLGNN